MGQSLTEIAQSLRDTNKKVQLIYAFNGVGKTRLSRAFKELISPKSTNDESEEHKIKVLYYNAFTEDLFYWDNDLDADSDRKLKIQPNNFTDWVLRNQGQERNIITHFQRYTSDKLTPRFNEECNEVTFSIEGGNEETIDNNPKLIEAIAEMRKNFCAETQNKVINTALACTFLVPAMVEKTTELVADAENHVNFELS